MDPENESDHEEQEESDDENELVTPTLDDVDIEELPKFTDTIDMEEMVDGPTTLFVGNYSANCTSLNDALEYVCTSNDRVVVLPFSKDLTVFPADLKEKEQYIGDVVINTIAFKGVKVLGATHKNTFPVKEPLPKRDDDEDEVEEEEEELEDEDEEEEEVDEVTLKRRKIKLMSMKTNTTKDSLPIKGKLVLMAKEGIPNFPRGFPEEDDEEVDDNEGESEQKEHEETEGEEETNKKNKIKNTPQIFFINGISFFMGCDCQAKSIAQVEDCAFGSKTLSDEVPITAKMNALSTVKFSSCIFYGAPKSALYCYPYARNIFVDCDIIGANPMLHSSSSSNFDGNHGIPKGLHSGYQPPAVVPQDAPTIITSAQGIFSDDSQITVENCDIKNFMNGIYCINDNKKCRILFSRISDCQQIGIWLEQGSSPLIKDCKVKRCGRETLLIGNNNCHPSVENCIFVGEIRIKPDAVPTGISNNVIVVPEGIEYTRQLADEELKASKKREAKKILGPLRNSGAVFLRNTNHSGSQVFLQELDTNGKKNQRFLINQSSCLLKGFKFVNKEPVML